MENSESENASQRGKVERDFKSIFNSLHISFVTSGRLAEFG